jgi:type IV pilus assembly protein PilX
MTLQIPVTSRYRRQQGVALFVALISMVLLSLAGIALVRSVDTTSSVASNIAFRQGSIGPVNRAIEEAIDALFKSKLILNQDANDMANSYFAALQPGETTTGIPAALAGDYNAMTLAYSGAGLSKVKVDGTTFMEVRSVIERVCNAPGGVTIATCDTLPPKVSSAGTDNKNCKKLPSGVCIPLPPIPNFRVTVRVDLPNSNTVSHAQAFLR